MTMPPDPSGVPMAAYAPGEPIPALDPDPSALVPPTTSPWSDAFAALAALVIVSVLATSVGSKVGMLITVGDLETFREVHQEPIAIIDLMQRTLVAVGGLLLLTGRARAAGVALIAAVPVALGEYALGVAGIGSFGSSWAHPELIAILQLAYSIVPIAFVLVAGIALVEAPSGRRGIDLWGVDALLGIGVLWAAAVALQNWVVVEAGADVPFWVIDVGLRVVPWFIGPALVWWRIRARTDRVRLRRVLLTAWLAFAAPPFLVRLGPLSDWAFDRARLVPPHVRAVFGGLLLVDVLVLLVAGALTVVLLRPRPAPLPLVDATGPPVVPAGLAPPT